MTDGDSGIGCIVLAGGRSLPPALRLVVVGGEKIAPERYEAWRQYLARAGGQADNHVL